MEPAVEGHDRGLACREGIEELVRRVRLEDRVGRESRERHVGGADQQRDLRPRDVGEDDQVFELELGDALLDPLLLGPVSGCDDRDTVLARLAQRDGCVDELVDSVRDAHRPCVDGDELAVEAVPLPERGIGDLGAEVLDVAHVRDQDDVLGGNPSLDEHVAHLLAADDNPASRPVELPLERLGRPDLRPSREEAQADRHRRPQILELEDERGPPQARGKYSGDPDRQRARRGEDDVGGAGGCGEQSRPERESAVGEHAHPLRKCLCVRHLQQNDVEPVEPAARDHSPSPLAFELHAPRVAPDDRHLVPALEQPLREVVDAGVRGRSRASELRVDVEDPHGADGDSRPVSGRPGSNRPAGARAGPTGRGRPRRRGRACPRSPRAGRRGRSAA